MLWKCNNRQQIVLIFKPLTVAERLHGLVIPKLRTIFFCYLVAFVFVFIDQNRDETKFPNHKMMNEFVKFSTKLFSHFNEADG